MFHRSRSYFALAVLSVVVALAAPSLHAQDNWKKAPAPIDRILDTGPTPTVSLSPDDRWMLIVEPDAMPSIAEINAEVLRVAGMQVNARTGAPHGARTIAGLLLKPVGEGEPRRITFPKGARIRSFDWSPKSTHVAVILDQDDRLALWVVDVATVEARSLSSAWLNGLFGEGDAAAWLADGSGFVARTLPEGRGPRPMRHGDIAGPIVQTAEGKAAPTWTATNTLNDATDVAVFDFLLESQLAWIGLDGVTRKVGKPGLFVETVPSPDGTRILVQTLHQPYSYRVAWSMFPRRTEVWTMDGKVEKIVADTPLQEIPLGAHWTVDGPRSFQWHPLAGATLLWTEALDGGDPKRKVEKRDRLRELAAPFTTEPRTVFESEYRIGGGRGGALAFVREDLAFLTEFWGPTRRLRTHVIDPRSSDAPTRLFQDRSSQDRYADPGNFVMTLSDRGTSIVQQGEGGTVFLTGAGASPEGDRPFIDRLNLDTLKTERLFQSTPPYYESPVAVLDAKASRIVTRIESVVDVPNYVVRTRADGSALALTRFSDPAPEFAGIQPEIITYDRADGVKLSAKLYLPKGWTKEKGPLPFLFWAYPIEFKDAAAAAQMRGSSCRFVRPSLLSPDHLYMLSQGYGILDDPAMPIIGEGETEPNDTYLEQLVSSAAAAIDKVVAMGVADRDRIAIGGHSYGAFMTANLLAHSDLFRTGIARSGAYNRSLTPFGFQGEARSYWQAQSTYATMSPFNFADRIDEPVLLIHGQNDSNSGTFPIQTERLFGALKGLGGTARYVVLPGEDHGYRAKESVHHVLWEMTDWLDRQVKNAGPRVVAKASGAPANTQRRERGERTAAIVKTQDGNGGAVPKQDAEKKDDKAAKRRSLGRRLDIARAKLAQTVADGESSITAVENALVQAEEEKVIAESKLEQFTKIDKPNRLAAAALALRGAKDRAQEADEELKQIEIMYKDQDLQEMTAEFVINRGKRNAERAKEQIAIEERAFDALKSHELPRQQRQMEIEVRAKTKALEKARRDIVGTARQHRIAVMSAEAEVAGIEDELSSLGDGESK